MSNCIPKLTRNVKSLYLVTIEEITIPSPKPNNPIENTNIGKRKMYILGCIEETKYKL